MHGGFGFLQLTSLSSFRVENTHSRKRQTRALFIALQPLYKICLGCNAIAPIPRQPVPISTNKPSAYPASQPRERPGSGRTRTQAWPEAHGADCCLGPRQGPRKVVDLWGARGSGLHPFRRDQPPNLRLRHQPVNPQLRLGPGPILLLGLLEDRICRFLPVDHSLQWHQSRFGDV